MGEALMDTNKMREQFSNEFDAWLDGYEKDREANGWMPLEPYVRKHMRNAFVASREAVVVVLPKQYGIGGMASDYRDQGIEECRDAIRAQGLRVAP